MLDVSNFQACREQLELLKPDVIVNTAGVADWRAAARNREQTWNTLVRGADNLAKLGAFLKIPLIHLSCHSVFGMGMQPSSHLYTETDPVAPPNFLASAMSYSEHAVMRLGQTGQLDGFSYWVLRCGHLFSPYSEHRQWRTDLTQQVLSPPRTSQMPSHLLANDLKITPCFVPHLAKVIIWLAENRKTVPQGLYHVANSGVTTPFDFAYRLRNAIHWQGRVFEPAPHKEIAQLMGDSPAEIVHSTPLSIEKLEALTPIEMPTWQEAIAEFSDQAVAV
jgi:dTDP-4-dehydrorhamnose reductase